MLPSEIVKAVLWEVIVKILAALGVDIIQKHVPDWVTTLSRSIPNGRLLKVGSAVAALFVSAVTSMLIFSSARETGRNQVAPTAIGGESEVDAITMAFSFTKPPNESLEEISIRSSAVTLVLAKPAVGEESKVSATLMDPELIRYRASVVLAGGTALRNHDMLFACLGAEWNKTELAHIMEPMAKLAYFDNSSVIDVMNESNMLSASAYSAFLQQEVTKLKFVVRRWVYVRVNVEYIDKNNYEYVYQVPMLDIQGRRRGIAQCE